LSQIPIPWRELSDAGIRIAVRGNQGTIHIPADLSCLGLLFALAAIVAAIVAAAVALAFRVSPAIAVLLAAIILAVPLVIAAYMRSWRPFHLTVDLDTGDVVIPPHGVADRGFQFNRRDVVSVGVDWLRSHGERASADAPISSIAFRLATAEPCEEWDRPQAFCVLSSLGGTRARVLAEWLYRHVVPPEARRFPLDPDLD
jgi:hypothetical protein